MSNLKLQIEMLQKEIYAEQSRLSKRSTFCPQYYDREVIDLMFKEQQLEILRVVESALKNREHDYIAEIPPAKVHDLSFGEEK